MSKKHKNRARKVISTVLACVGLVYLAVTVVVRGTTEADEVSGVIAGFALVLTTLGLFRARGEPPPRRSARPRPAQDRPLSITSTGAHALMSALGFPARPSCDRQPGCPRLINARPFAGPATGTGPDPAGSLVVVVVKRPGTGA
jgi:hypothetical protein